MRCICCCTVLGKEVPIGVVGRGNALKFFGDQLRRLKDCHGWKWITVTLDDKNTNTPSMRMV